MLNYNQKMDVIFTDAKILTARRWNMFCGLPNNVPPKNEAEQAKLDKLKAMKTYDEIKETGTRTPYKAYMAQFGY